MSPSYCFTRIGKSPLSSCVRSARRPPDVPLAVRRALDELAELVAVALGPADVPPALHHQQLGRLGAEVEPVAVQDAAMDDEVVALPVRQVPEDRLQGARSLGDVDQLVGLRVPVEMRVVLVRLDVQHRDVLVEQERDAVERRAAAALHLRGAEVAVAQRLVGIGLVLGLPRAAARS